ncbi:cytochrome c biogenesis protein CcdA [Cryobacterium sp. TMT1-62]|uniref:Cytochrome c biogenesis protein CcdA n=1 Tax=Cryobacterium sandaracinum TaxID=1259247 RepID=A0ABY2J1L4_9MICO|nr:MULTISPECIES: cytochrome c biogenesis protein CcdA [Cryobacterium]TFB62257.1 cytochrome c biogenesis protein CcdA [Cryobacterium sp. Hz7]TFC69914.1 cytochrome c biogenesis protein CcdA [Cryobacterium sp. TMT2-4]TFC98830.1 cytochrome c biogenesis protein CcdA [Cryobacterium sandaracinum]TFD33597.1 cytochrome c biogenesis protein CcdA [Cryobacterium sp. TMT1-62]
MDNPFGEIVFSGQLYLAIPIAVLAGLVSFASPCILPLVPGYLAYIGGFTDGSSTPARGDRRGRNRLLLGVLLFILGFTLVFVLTGVIFGVAGFWLNQYRDAITRIAGVVVILLGLVFVGQFGFAQRSVKATWRPGMGLAGAPLLGAVFAVGWTPCTGPTLTAINSLSLTTGSPWQGGLLALFYALGLGIPFLLIALGLSWATGAVSFLKRHVRAINLSGGLLLVLIGVLMVSGVWNAWLLDLQGTIGSYVPAI